MAQVKGRRQDSIMAASTSTVTNPDATDSYTIDCTAHAINMRSSRDGTLIYSRKTLDPKTVKNNLKVQLRRYRSGSGKGNGHYQNRVEHTIDLIDVNCLVHDTLMEAPSTMRRNDLFALIISKLHSLMDP